MYIKRNIDQDLIDWKNSKGFKPLLLRGARQVGKTSTIRNLGKNFDHFIEINFELYEELRHIFENQIDPVEICKQIELLTGNKIISNRSLLFFDEVQFCPRAIESLRYFYELMPELNVIATGSLLEFALNDLPTLGVGRIRSIFMYPLSFEEFLVALHFKELNKEIRKSTADRPLPEAITIKLENLVRQFLIIGGMPEAVKKYIESNSYLEVQNVLNDIILTYQNDFSKYKRRVPASRINNVFKEVVFQTGRKFSYTPLNTEYNNIQIRDTLELLIMAGLVYPVTHTAANGIPLGAEANQKKNKYLIFDTGIFLKLLELNVAELFAMDNYELINKGSLAELYVGLEMIKYNFSKQYPQLYYWQREEKNSQAEIDYIIQQHDLLIPIEVKAGKSGSMKSLHLFIQEKKSKRAIRISLENFSKLDIIYIYPMYGIKNIFN